MSSHLDFRRSNLGRRKAPWTKRPDDNGSADAELAAAALDAIDCLTTIPMETLQVSARNGWLHLQGTLTSRHQRTILEEVTRHLPGVRGVINSIRIEALPFRAEARQRPGESPTLIFQFSSTRTIPTTESDYLEG